MKAAHNKNRAVRRLKDLLQPLVFILRKNVSRLKRSIVGSRVEGFLVSTGQGLFLVDPEDMGVGRSLIGKGAYGEDEIKRICSLASEDSNILFVGTHIGALAIPVSKKVRRVTAIEANPHTFRLLERNILMNRCENITAIQIAASDRSGDLEFVMSKTNSGGSKRMPVVMAYKYFYDKPSVVKVRADKLDDAAPGDYSVVVMDIEGSEYFALKGMSRILSKANHLIVEFLPHHLKNVSGVSVKEMLAVIEPHFDVLRIPSRDLTIEKPQFLSVLEEMYQANEGDNGIVFSKSYASLK